jgi:hypothetical protein
VADIVIESQMNLRDYTQFAWFSSLKRGKRYKTSAVVAIGVFAFALLSMLALLFVMPVGKFISDWGLRFVLVAMFPVSYYIGMRLSIKKAYRQSQALYESAHHFVFTPDHLRIETAGEAVSGNTEIPYEALLGVYELKNMFCVYIAGYVQLISKRNIDEGKAAQLRYLLHDKLGERFIARSKSL